MKQALDKYGFTAAFGGGRRDEEKSRAKERIFSVSYTHLDVYKRQGLIDAGWQKEFDKDSAPYTSTIVFLVRKENPKQIHDCQDLVKNGVEVIRCV